MTALWPKLKRVLIILAIPIALAIPLVFVLQDFVHDAIVMPLAYQFWLAGVIFDALPQGCLLAVALALGVYIAARSLGRVVVTRPEGSRASRPSTGNVKRWLDRFDLLTHGSYTRERFDHHIGQFVLRATAHDRRMAPRDLAQLVESGASDIPEALLPYMDAAIHSGLLNHRRPANWLRALIPWRRRRRVSLADVQDQIEMALHVIESELRIPLPEEENGKSDNNTP